VADPEPATARRCEGRLYGIAMADRAD
jgi:hypothetical protein